MGTRSGGERRAAFRLLWLSAWGFIPWRGCGHLAAPCRGINPLADSKRMLKQPVSIFHVPLPRLPSGNQWEKAARRRRKYLSPCDRFPALLRAHPAVCRPKPGLYPYAALRHVSLVSRATRRNGGLRYATPSRQKAESSDPNSVSLSFQYALPNRGIIFISDSRNPLQIHQKNVKLQI